MSELNLTHSNGNKVKLTTPDTLAANKTFKLPGADGSSGQFLKTDGSGALSFTSQLGRNLFLNGAVNISQRGDSYASAYTYKADQWYIFPTGSTTTRLTTSPPDGFTYYFRCPSATASIIFSQQIELEAQGKVGRYKGKTVTVSWYARTESSNTMYVDAAFKNNSGGGDYTSIVSGSGSPQSLTSSWARYSQTFTISATPNSNNKCFSVMIRTPSGQGGTVEATGFQCEFGDTMTDFEYISIAEDLARCQRYCQKASVYVASGTSGNNNIYGFTANFMTEMRAAPSLLSSSSIDGTGNFSSRRNGSETSGNPTIRNSNTNSVTLGHNSGQQADWLYGQVLMQAEI